MNSVILSFLKTNKISYYLSGNSKVIFPCFFCHNPLSMEVSDYSWECSHCNKNGNLVTLDKELQNIVSSPRPFFNPKDTHKEILQLTKKISDINLRTKIELRINKLYQHFKKSSG